MHLVNVDVASSGSCCDDDEKEEHLTPMGPASSTVKGASEESGVETDAGGLGGGFTQSASSFSLGATAGGGGVGVVSVSQECCSSPMDPSEALYMSTLSDGLYQPKENEMSIMSLLKCFINLEYLTG